MIVDALRALRFEIWAWRVSRAGARRLQSIGERHLRVQVGCGSNIRDGWLNIDLQKTAPRHDYVIFDLRRGLPLPKESCDVIYSSHFIEHLTLAQAREHFRYCHNALEPTGTLRLALPDFRRLLTAYLAEDRDMLNPLAQHCGASTNGECMDYVLHQNGEHRSFHDVESLTRDLRAAGFRDVRETVFDAALDSSDPMRMRYSLYVEARK